MLKTFLKSDIKLEYTYFSYLCFSRLYIYFIVLCIEQR